MEVNYESLLQHSNQMKNYIKSSVAEKPSEILTKKPNTKKWSAIETIDHLNKVYDQYLNNFEKTIKSAPELSDGNSTPMQRSIMGRLSIYSMKPKGDKRKFKMKTFDFFQPQIDASKTDDTINTFLQNKERFNDLIKSARLKNLKGVRIPTALGEKVKFFVPECLEFILAHEERHMIQIAQSLENAR